MKADVVRMDAVHIAEDIKSFKLMRIIPIVKRLFKC